MTRRDWGLLAALGVVMYALTQGAQFLALDRLPAQTTSLVLSFTPAMVALLGMLVLSERPSRRQVWGVALFLVGAFTFLYPVAFPRAELVGLAIAVVGLASNAGASVLGRFVNRVATLPASVVTAVSMGVGAAILSAVESSVVNNTMLIQIAVLAWLFLDEHLGARQLTGLVLASLGTLIVQLGSPRSAERAVNLQARPRPRAR